jgi:UbiD family decarboxylase
MYDLREHIKTLDARGYLIRVTRQINKDTELMPLVRWQFLGLPEEKRKAFLFENIVDVRGRKYDMPVAVCALAASRQVYAIGLGCEPNQIMERWLRAQSQKIPAVMVETGPVHEEVFTGKELERRGLDDLPLPISTPGFDNAPYTTLSHWVTRDPETGVRNVGNYRGQLKAPNRVGMYMNPHQHGMEHFNKWRKLGKPMPAAIIMGGPPSVAFTSVAKIPYGTDEYDVAGGLIGAPIELVRCKTVDLEVPAWAEIVVEGFVPTDQLEMEGSFGEFPGFMGMRSFAPFLEVTAVTRRKGAICPAFISQFCPSESSRIKSIANESVCFNHLRYNCNIPSVKKVAYHERGGSGRQLCVIQMEKTNPAHPMQALYATTTLDASSLGKIIIAVDEDIDPYDIDAVMWAICWRVQPHRDVKIVTHKSSQLDYSAIPPWIRESEIQAFPGVEGCSVMLIDATRPWPYTPVSLPAKEYMESSRKIWEELGLGELNVKGPWHGYELGFWSDEERQEADLAIRGEYYRTGEKQAKNRISPSELTKSVGYGGKKFE